MRIIVFDLECTCWSERVPRERQETIEIGAVALASVAGPAVAEFRTFVRPERSPVLSGFCRNFTGITQEDVDQAPRFPEAMSRFFAFAGNVACRWVSFGTADKKQLMIDAAAHGMVLPEEFLARHVDARAAFAGRFGGPEPSFADALSRLGESVEKLPHRALEDARLLARIVARVL